MPTPLSVLGLWPKSLYTMTTLDLCEVCEDHLPKPYVALRKLAGKHCRLSLLEFLDLISFRPEYRRIWVEAMAQSSIDDKETVFGTIIGWYCNLHEKGGSDAP